MIRHCVMLRLRSDHDLLDLCDVIHGPGDVTDRVPGCKNLVFGPNSGVEAKSRDTSYGFTVDFDSAADLKRYSGDATYCQPGMRIVALFVDVADGFMIFDPEMSGPVDQ